MTKNEEITNKGWNFDNSYARLPKSFYTVLRPTPVTSPQLIILNFPLAESLGLDIGELQEKPGIAVLAGNRLPEGAAPLAQAYAGHQFGNFTMLGDGRAHLLGEQVTPLGKRLDIQLKGSGKTPYSRGGDGRAAVGPMLREYIMSEAMHALGIPTTRSLAVVTTGESVFRERELPGAILTRVASSHLRVGTFEYISQWGNTEDLRTLAGYTLQRHFPKAETDNFYSLLQEVVNLQAGLIAKWQLTGFIHGVMNTDNMALSGETIDYGPCAFMDTYDPSTVFSSIDYFGRYAYGNQPKIAAWNLAIFAKTLLPLLHKEREESVKIAGEALSDFHEQYHRNRLKGMRAKLGIFNEKPEDEALAEELLKMMHKYKADYTNTFRNLTEGKIQDGELFQSLEFKNWHKLWKDRLAKQQQSDTDITELMKRNNPYIIPRNHRVEEALEAAEQHGDYSVMERLLKVLSTPFSYSGKPEEYTSPPPPSSQPYQTFCGT